jgi:hypothetical protein
LLSLLSLLRNPPSWKSTVSGVTATPFSVPEGVPGTTVSALRNRPMPGS